MQEKYVIVIDTVVFMCLLALAAFSIFKLLKAHTKKAHKDSADDLNYRFLCIIPNNTKPLYADGIKRVYAGLTCIKNSPLEEKMYCSIESQNNGKYITNHYILKYDSFLLKDAYALNAEGPDTTPDPTCTTVLKAQLEVLEAQEKYEEAAIVMDALHRIEKITTK